MQPNQNNDQALERTGGEFFRFLINGVAASGVHFLVLWICFKALDIGSAGLSNFIASIVGIAASFAGNKYFVFRGHTETFAKQSGKFVILYALIALLHGGVSLVLTDIYGIDYRIGFIIALILQVTLGFVGSKLFVFNK